MSQHTDTIVKMVLDSGRDGPHILLLSGVHGDEYEPMIVNHRLYQQLKGQIVRGRITFVPNGNETAYQSASRYGTDGLDLARICPGNRTGTCSEQSAYLVSELIKTADYLIDMHTGGVLYDIFPLAGYGLHTNPDVLNQQRRMALSYGLPLVWGTDPRPDGRTLSVARDAGIPAIYLEYGGGTGFRSYVVDAYVAGTLNLLRQLGMIAGEWIKPAPEKVFWIEDARQDSGFLQGKMPSPADGIYLADARVGQQIEKGAKWGRLANPVTGTTTDLFADESGLVFLMRNTVKVGEGDALGGILPITQPGKVTIDEEGNATKEPEVDFTSVFR